MAERVRITEVGPRDGLQNEPGVIPTAEKVRLVELCCATGVDEVEVTSFVSPKWVPQLGDASEVFAGLERMHIDGDHCVLSALVPNEQGMLAALDVARTPGLLEKVAVFTAASQTFAQRNINATIEESIQRFIPIVQLAKKGGASGELKVRGYVSCVVTPNQMRADFRTVPYVVKPGAPVHTSRSFIVEAGRPGLQNA